MTNYSRVSERWHYNRELDTPLQHSARILILCSATLGCCTRVEGEYNNHYYCNLRLVAWLIWGGSGQVDLAD